MSLNRPTSPERATPAAALDSRRGVLLAAVASMGLAACANRGGPALPAAPSTAANAGEQRYRIGPLDALNIVVWRHAELSGAVPVRPDGFVVIPLAGELMAAGKTPEELAGEIRTALAKYVVEPVVNVVVTGFQGVYGEQIRIVGEAARPQSVNYRKNMTLLDVMIQAGGLTDFADGNAAVLIRGAEGGKQYRVRLKDLLRRGDISANVDMMPGDIVLVPQGWF